MRLKLNTIKSEFKGRTVLLVDDSVVRGTTSREIVQLAKEAGAKAVYFASAAPPVRHPNVYGIDIPTCKELIAYQNTEEEIARLIGVEVIIYNDLADVEESVRGGAMAEEGKECRPLPLEFDSSCFDGRYCTDVPEAYLRSLETGEDDDDGGGGGGAREADVDVTEKKMLSMEKEDRRDKVGGTEVEKEERKWNLIAPAAASYSSSNKNSQGVCESIFNLSSSSSS